MLTSSRLESFLAAFPRLRIGLVGDLFLDRYLELAPGVHELSIETGLEAYQIPCVRNAPGAMGTVLNNLAALGVGQLVPVTVIGDDGHGYDLLRELRRLPVDTSHVLLDPQRLTPTYTKPMRPIANGVAQELNRLDVRSREPIANAMIDKLLRQVRVVWEQTDGLIVLDQINERNWGVVSDVVRAALDELGRANPNKLLYVDSRQYLGLFGGAILKGNRSEVLKAAGEVGQVRAAALKLAERTGRVAYCTMSEEGILVARPGQEPQLVPGVPVSGPVDIVGAGDAATSGIVTALLCGATEFEAAMLGNLVASITVQQLGTTGTASPAQVLKQCREASS